MTCASDMADFLSGASPFSVEPSSFLRDSGLLFALKGAGTVSFFRTEPATYAGDFVSPMVHVCVFWGRAPLIDEQVPVLKSYPKAFGGPR